MSELEELRAENARLHAVIVKLEERPPVSAGLPEWLNAITECDWCTNHANGLVLGGARPYPACGECIDTDADSGMRVVPFKDYRDD